MAKQYRVGFMVRLINSLIKGRVASKKGDDRWHLLTTRGRRSGERRTTPVTIIEVNGSRWLVAPYGSVGWVHNLRARPTAVISRGVTEETVDVFEVGPEDAAPVLQHYLETVSIVRPYFDVTHESSLADIAAEAGQHPVFRLSNPPS